MSIQNNTGSVLFALKKINLMGRRRENLQHSGTVCIARSC